MEQLSLLLLKLLLLSIVQIETLNLPKLKAQIVLIASSLFLLSLEAFKFSFLLFIIVI